MIFMSRLGSFQSVAKISQVALPLLPDLSPKISDRCARSPNSLRDFHSEALDDPDHDDRRERPAQRRRP